MPKSEINTKLRFTTSSLFTIMTGLAFVLAVVGPLFAALEEKAQAHFMLLLFCFFVGYLFSIFTVVWKRRLISRECGDLLTIVALQSERSIVFLRWIFLLVILPLIFSPIYFIVTRVTSGALFFPFSTTFALILLFWGSQLGKWGLLLWSEGFGNSLELCERGVVITDRFHRWNAPTIEDIFLRKINNDLVVKVKGFFRIVRLPESQQKLIRSILADHYRRPQPPNPFASNDD